MVRPKLTLLRHTFSDDATIGSLYFIDEDGHTEIFCNTLEPSITSDKLVKCGSYDLTCLPTPSWSRFAGKKNYLYQIRLYVPGREGILIHIGNTSEDTDGCILVGFAPLFSSNPHLLKSTSAYLRLVYLLNRYDSDCFTIEIRNK